MKEHELNAIFDIIPDPAESFVNIHDMRLRMEVERIVRIFQLVKAQNEEFHGGAVVNYADLGLLPCEN